jgi:hypothetical protein
LALLPPAFVPAASAQTLLIFAAVTISGCAARPPARTFSELQQRVQPGTTLYVIDDRGNETRGRLAAISPDGLTLDRDDAPLRFAESAVRQVQRYGDPLWNGFLIGMAVGTPGMLIADPTYDPCPDNPRRLCPNSQVGQRIVALTVMGAIGAGIDALIRGRHQLYLSPGQLAASAARVAITPQFSRSSAALRVTLRLSDREAR